MVKKLADAEVVTFPWGKIEWLVSGEQQNSNTTTFGRVTILAGQANGTHRHPNCDEVLHVLSGKIDHRVEDETFAMEAGDTISIPTGIWHNATAIGSSDAVMIISFSSPDRQSEFA